MYLLPSNWKGVRSKIRIQSSRVALRTYSFSFNLLAKSFCPGRRESGRGSASTKIVSFVATYNGSDRRGSMVPS